MAFHWRCTFCDRDTTLNNADWESHAFLFDGRKHGEQVLQFQVHRCPNLSCGEFAMAALMGPGTFNHNDGEYCVTNPEAAESFRLRPRSEARQLPHVPEPIREDYEEACLIAELSPKASATLCRRALQGMIRDFWGVSGKRNLREEVEAIKDRVHPDTWTAIDGVRTIGNIGAHMEKDINVIVEVEPGEAKQLIWLIELLARDWYDARETRKARLAELRGVAERKGAQRKGGGAAGDASKGE